MTISPKYVKGSFDVQGTSVMTNLTSVLFDPAEWEKPDSFHPAHFLDAGGRFVRREAFLPFSAGNKPKCVGRIHVGHEINTIAFSK